MILFFCVSCQRGDIESEEWIFLFSFFVGNGEDGLHLAYSHNGLYWEPIQEGKSFITPTAGEDKLMRDPCIIRGGDGLFHLVWTVSWNEKTIGYASSPDLIHWSKQKTLPVMTHEENARNTWAPEIFFDENANQYMIFWSSTITGKFPETQTTLENGYNHRIYYTLTNDFVNFSPTEILYEPGFNIIDATIIKENGDFVMFLKDETREPEQKNIRISKSKTLNKGYSQASNPISGNYWAEGPTIIKVKDKWILYFDKYIEKKMGALISSDLETWVDISDQVKFPKGTRHGSVLKITKYELDQLKKALL